VPGPAGLRHRRRRWAALTLAVTLLSGCSGSATSDLLTPCQDALSAVASAVLSLDLLREGRSTTALAEVVLDGGVDQLAADEQTVVKLSVSTPAQRENRDAVLAAIRQAAAAAVDARDAFALSTSPQAAEDRLTHAAADLAAATKKLEAAG
jgi:hypothetical protein